LLDCHPLFFSAKLQEKEEKDRTCDLLRGYKNKKTGARPVFLN
jgi:hypothetical protein